MNNEPCVRFGMRISPKISEKPADSRNNRPPKVMLLAVSTSQKVMPFPLVASPSFRDASAASGPGIQPSLLVYLDSGFGASRRPGMTDKNAGAVGRPRR